MQSPSADNDMVTATDKTGKDLISPSGSKWDRVVNLGRSRYDPVCTASCCCESTSLCVSCLLLSITLPCFLPGFLSKTRICKGRIMNAVHCVSFNYAARIVTLYEFTREVARVHWKSGRVVQLPFHTIAGFWCILVGNPVTGPDTGTDTGSNSWCQPVVAVKRLNRFDGGNSGISYDWVRNSEFVSREVNEKLEQFMGPAVRDYDFLPLIFHGRFNGRSRRRLTKSAAGHGSFSASASDTKVGVNVSMETSYGIDTGCYNHVRFYQDYTDLMPRLRLLNECLRCRHVEDEELWPPASNDLLPVKAKAAPARSDYSDGDSDLELLHDMTYVQSL
jgi:hypothetical protein